MKLKSAVCFFMTIAFLSLITLLVTYKSKSFSSSHKKLIVCTTNIIADTVRHIVGDRATVISIMGPGVDPHTYKARERDVRLLASADILLYHGLHLEGRMAHILKHMNTYHPTSAVTDCLEKNVLIESDTPGIYDPHIWHDVQLWRTVASYIGTQLAKYDSNNADFYTRNTNKYCQQLNELDTAIRTYIAKLNSEQRILLTAHDAFSYFGKTYGFKVVGLQGISTDAEISTRDVQTVAEIAVKNRISALFFESSVPERAIRAVQQAVHARNWHITAGSELFSDSLDSPGSPAGTYHGMIWYNVKHIVHDLLPTPTININT